MASTTRAVSLILFALVICQAASARTLADDPTPSERVVAALKEVTTLSENLRVATNTINIFNAPQQGFIIAQGFTGIIAKITLYISYIPSPDSANAAPFSDDDAKLIVAALTDFVKVHQALLSVVIGKHGILTLAPFFEPIRIALVSLEAVVDTFAFKLIALIPTQAPAAQTQVSSLDGTVTLAIATYSNPTLATPVSTDPLAVTIVTAIETVTTLSANLRIDVEAITIFNAPVQGGKIAAGFGLIITTVAEATTSLGPYTNDKATLVDADAKLVVAALTDFVKVHQALLNVVIGKHGILTLAPFFEPIRIALVNLEAVVDTFAFALIGLIPTQAPAAKTQIDSLDITIGVAIQTYSTPFVKAALSGYFGL